MNIRIGENIKRLRRERELTQEQLAEVLNVSITAVSKWERSETMPDITLLFPLAHFFGVSLDELMGYDRERIEQDIQDALTKYRELWRNVKVAEAQQFIIDTYKKYPNDYRVMSQYMWNLGGDYADNDPNVLLQHKDEFRGICAKLIEGCTNVRLRLDAYNMLGKLLHAEGRTKEAVELYEREFPDWFQTSGQKTEQLFAKHTKEFREQLRCNLYSLTDFAVNKKVKEIWFCHDCDIDERIRRGIALIDGIRELRLKTDSPELCLAEYAAACELWGKCRHDGTDEQTKACKARCDEAVRDCFEVMKTDENIEKYAKRSYPLTFDV